MSWTRTILAGLAAGVAVDIANFVQHGLIMGNTYRQYDTVFSQQQANPLFFLLIDVCIGITAAILFARSRGSWAAGIKGGVIFGCFLGLVSVFPNFYYPLVIDGFPYHLAWCWGGINLIDAVIGGAVLGLIYKQ